MTQKLKLIRKVTTEECFWLDEDMNEGDIVYVYDGYTYGCIGDGIAVTKEYDVTPFFELPLDSLKPVDET